MPLASSIHPRKVLVQKSKNALWHPATLSDDIYYTVCGFMWGTVHKELPLEAAAFLPLAHLCVNCIKAD